MTLNETASSTARLVIDHPAASRVLMRHGIDFCCAGDQRLDQACAKAGITTVALLAEVLAEESRAGITNERWADRPISDLIDHILTRYHDPLKRELSRLADLGLRLKRAHPGHNRLLEAIDAVNAFAHSMREHVSKEELALFPWIRSGHAGAFAKPIQIMLDEHDDHGEHLRTIRKLTDGFHPPEYACATWRAFYAALAELEREIMEHVHLENHALFPRALGAKH
jgi:regulator of cell morphogenesis and NO signaling